MTPKYESHHDPRKQARGGSPAGNLNERNQPMAALNSVTNDSKDADQVASRFELLSAYLDGEATAAERRQVQEWLDSDPQVKHLHARLLKLRQGLHSLPVPMSAQSVEETVDGVFRRIDGVSPVVSLDRVRQERPDAASKNSRFELLSAYLDGEASPSERRQVQEWLDSDPQVKRLYFKLLKLRQGIQGVPVPEPQKTSQDTAQQVFRRVDRQRHRKMAWGGTAIAALFMAALSGLMPGQQSYIPQIASSPPVKESAEPMIALNGPIVEIPKAAIAPDEKSTVSRALFVE